jgi:hypothetical protein
LGNIKYEAVIRALRELRIFVSGSWANGAKIITTGQSALRTYTLSHDGDGDILILPSAALAGQVPAKAIFGATFAAPRPHLTKDMVGGAATSATWTSMPTGTNEMFGGSRQRRSVDLTTFAEFRFFVNVQTVGISGSKLALQFSTDGGSTWNYIDTGSSTLGVNDDITTTGQKTTAWTALAAAAKADILIRPVGTGASAGSSSPAFSGVSADFR